MPRSSFLFVSLALVALACTGDDPAIVPSNESADGGGLPSGNLTLTTQGPVTIVQGEIAKVPITIGRTPTITGPVSVVVSNPPADVSAAPLVIAPDGTSGDLQLEAGPAAAHGRSSVTLVATAEGESAVTTLEVFVRGKPGSLDSSFDTAGSMAVDLDAGNVTPVAMEPQGPEKVVALAQADSKCILVRFDHDGRVDASFGDAGKRVIDGSGDLQCRALAIQPDGKILVAGSRVPDVLGMYQPFVARFDSTGMPDSTFATGGTFGPDGGSETFLDGLALQPDGKVVAVGRTTGDEGGAMFVLRLTTTGAPDSGFGGGGTSLIERKAFPQPSVPITDVRARGAGLLGNGEIVVVGLANGLMAFARLTNAGKLVDGSAMTFSAGSNAGATHDVRHVIQTSPERTLLALVVSDPVERASLVALANGSPDPTFGNFGRLPIDFDPAGGAFFGATLLREEGRILAVGASGAVSNTDWALARVSGKGELDPTFGTQGKVLTTIGPHADAARAAVVVSAGRALVAGSSANAAGVQRMVLARYWL